MTRIADAAPFGSLVLEELGGEMANDDSSYKAICRSKKIVTEVAEQAKKMGFPSGESGKKYAMSYMESLLKQFFRWGVWARFGYNVFDLTASLAAGLLLTEPAEFDPESFRLPFPCFCIRLPPGTLQAPFDGVQRSLVALWVHEMVAPDGERVLRLALESEESPQRQFYELWRNRPLSRIYESGTSEFRPFSDNEPEFEDNNHAIDLAIHLVRNFCAWLESAGGLSGRKPQNESSRSGSRARPKIWSLGHEVKLSKEMRDAAAGLSLGGAERAAWKLRVQFVVRGHWRNQVHGPGRSLRRRQWIEPFFKGPESAEAWSHLYKAK